jgi:hypothetical protein
MSGPEFRDRVDAVAPHVAARIVFMTGGISWEPVRMRLVGTSNLVLEKPFDMAALRELIRRRRS